MILFLNKTDLFKEKLEKQKKDITACPAFINYTGLFSFWGDIRLGGCNFEAACAFIKQRFVELNQSTRTIYVHFTCAVNTENIEFVFKAIRDTVLKRIMQDIIIY